jgi:hypothetical protein
MTVLEIAFRIPEETVRLEGERCPATMSLDDLEWCFAGEVDFVDSQSQRLLLSLDVCLLGFAGDLSGIVKQLRADGRYEIPDRYGTYLLEFTIEGGDVHVGNGGHVFTAQSRQVTAALRHFWESLTTKLVYLFPGLQRNPDFSRLCHQISDRLTTRT